MINGLVAHWDFAHGLTAIGGDHAYRLRLEAGKAPVSIDGGIRLAAGTTLYVPYAEIGGLDMSASQAVSVIAVAKRPKAADTLLCIAGRWDEHGKMRQYALFHHVPLVGGHRRPYGHVSCGGGATPGWKYSVDGAATKRTTTLADRFHALGMTYDGKQALAYLDGTTDANPKVRIRQTAPDKTMTSDRNPYRYPDGLNRNSRAPFRVNAASPGQHTRDVELRRLWVFRRALTPAEMAQLK